MKILFIGNKKSVLSVERYNVLKKLEIVTDVEFVDSIKEKNILIRLFKYFKLFLIIYFKIKFNKIEIIIYHGVYHFLLNKLRISNLKIISIPQGSEINEEYHGRVKFFVDALLKNSHYIFARSHSMQKRLVNSLHVNSSKTVLFNWGINEYFFKSNIIREPKKITILSYRATGKLYNIDVIFKAIQYLKLKNNNIHFIYVEHNKDFDFNLDMGVVDEYLSNLKYTELAPIVARADISISIPSYDGFATSIMESLASGSYPIISDIAAYTNIFPDEPWLIAKTRISLEDLCQLLDKTLQDIVYLNEYKEKRREFALTNYSRDSQLKILTSVLKDLTKGN